jgi:hypothetical protein
VGGLMVRGWTAGVKGPPPGPTARPWPPIRGSRNLANFYFVL